MTTLEWLIIAAVVLVILVAIVAIFEFEGTEALELAIELFD